MMNPLTHWLLRYKRLFLIGLGGLILFSLYQYLTHPIRADQYLLVVSDEFNWPRDYIFATLPNGSRWERISQGMEPSCSPDGRQIAASVYTDWLDRTAHIFIMNADGSNPIQLTFGRGFNTFPAWSPDGKRLAFLAYNDRFTIIELNSRKVTNLVGTEWYIGYPVAWSPNGQQLVIATYKVVGRNRVDSGLYIVNADDGQMRRLTEGNEAWPDWSPDGQHILFLHSIGPNFGSQTLRIINADGSGAVDILPAEFAPKSPKWSPDNQRIAFIGHERQENGSILPTGIFVVNADGSGLTTVISPGREILGFEGGAIIPLPRSIFHTGLAWCKVR
jgi:Tol biopolymer transport system component